MKDPLTYKPCIKSFLYYPLVRFIILFLFISPLIVFLTYLFLPHLVLVVGVGLLFYALYFAISLHVSYKKELYILYSDKIVKKQGGLFSDYETVLTLKNVTNMYHIKPFLRYFLLKTGDLHIESAGSAESLIYLEGLPESDVLFSKILTLLQRNGFSLKREKVLDKRTPSSLAISFSIIRQIVVFLFSFIFIVLTLSPFSARFIQQASFQTIMFSTIGLAALFLLFCIPYCIVQYLLLKQKTYTLYSDAVVYEKLFLTKITEVIPIENLSDASFSQGLIDRLIHTYTIIISCQGSNNNIAFSNVPNGHIMQQKISTIAKSFSSLATRPSVVSSKKQSSFTENDSLSKNTSKKTTSQRTYFEKYMHKPRAFFFTYVLTPFILPFFFFFPFLIPFALIGLIFHVIKVYNTRYYVSKSSIVSDFSFISKKRIEYQDSKITALIYSRDIIDILFSTCSFKFWSIGSSEVLELKHIKEDALLFDFLKENHSFLEERKKGSIHPSFSIISCFSRFFFVFILLGIGIGATFFFIPFQLFILSSVALVLGIFALFIYQFILARVSKITIYKTYIVVEKGVLIKKRVFILKQNIKGLLKMSYPFLTKGTITFDVSGEQVYKDKNGQRTIPNTISIGFIDNALSFLIDPVSENVLGSYKPDPRNAVVLSLLTIIATPFIPFVLWYIRVKTFTVTTKRLIYHFGIFYKSIKEIPYVMIDHVDTMQSPLNKIFSNGKVLVYTTGSSSVDLVIGNVKEYKQISDVIPK